MRITLINQTFYPDVVSTAQHLKDLALWLTEAGHEVTVVASRRAYDNPKRLFPKTETWRGIRIDRVSNTGLGKRSKLTRIIDFGTFILACCWRLLWLPRQDLVVALTSPPIISFIGALFVRIRGGRFCYWVMDLNPDEAVAAGWLNPNSLAAKWLEGCSRFSLRSAQKIVVLDEFMREKLLRKASRERKLKSCRLGRMTPMCRLMPLGASAFVRHTDYRASLWSCIQVTTAPVIPWIRSWPRLRNWQIARTSHFVLWGVEVNLSA